MKEMIVRLEWNPKVETIKFEDIPDIGEDFFLSGMIYMEDMFKKHLDYIYWTAKISMYSEILAKDIDLYYSYVLRELLSRLKDDIFENYNPPGVLSINLVKEVFHEYIFIKAYIIIFKAFKRKKGE